MGEDAVQSSSGQSITVAIPVNEGDFENYLKGDISVDIRHELEATVQRHLSSTSGKDLGKELTDAVLHCHKTLVHSYRQTRPLTTQSAISTLPSLIGDDSTSYFNITGSHGSMSTSSDPIMTLDLGNIPDSGIPLRSCFAADGGEADIFSDLNLEPYLEQDIVNGGTSRASTHTPAIDVGLV
jgi:hypothetical protein